MARPTFSPISVPDDTKQVVSISAASPDSLYSRDSTAGSPGNMRLTKITVASIADIGGAQVQVFVGVRYASDGGGGNWTPLMAPILNPGDVVAASFSKPLKTDGDIVARSTATNLSTVTFEVEAF